MSELSVLLGCFGYNGFGSGWMLAKHGPANDTSELACGRCDRRKECWERHKVRVRTLLPAMCELSDELLKEGLSGAAYIKAFQLRVKEKDPNVMVEPYLIVMTGNMQDGGSVAVSGAPYDRQEVSLTWPLTPLE